MINPQDSRRASESGEEQEDRTITVRVPDKDVGKALVDKVHSFVSCPTCWLGALARSLANHNIVVGVLLSILAFFENRNIGTIIRWETNNS